MHRCHQETAELGPQVRAETVRGVIERAQKDNLIAAGVFALLISAWQYRLLVRYLWSTPFRPVAGIEAKNMKPIITQTPLMAIVIAIILIGAFAFGAVLLRVV